jgi:hypothetical protein
VVAQIKGARELKSESMSDLAILVCIAIALIFVVIGLREMFGRGWVYVVISTSDGREACIHETKTRSSARQVYNAVNRAMAPLR